MEGLKNSSTDSLLVAITLDNEVVYTGYHKEEYAHYYKAIKVWEPLEFGDVIVIPDIEGPFGTEDRVYMSGTVLGNSYNIFIVMSEQTVIHSMVDSLEVDSLNSIKDSVGLMLKAVGLLIVFTFVCGTVILMSLKQLYSKADYVLCPYYGNKHCAYNKEGNV